MRITAIDCHPVWIGHRNQLLLKISTDQGLYGWGESGFSGRERAVIGAVDHYRELLIGRDPMLPGAIWQELYRSQYFEGGRVLTAAISAIDIALHDIRGKALGVPVHQLLGGRVRDRVPALASTFAAPGPEMIEEAQSFVADGFQAIRLQRGGKAARPRADDNHVGVVSHRHAPRGNVDFFWSVLSHRQRPYKTAACSCNARLRRNGAEDGCRLPTAAYVSVKKPLLDTVQHPLHAKSVGKFSIIVAPRLHIERGCYLSAVSETFEQLLCLFTVLHHEDMRGASHRFGVIIVGRVKSDSGPLEFCVHDLSTHCLVFHRHTVRAITQHFHDLTKTALRIEGERLLACCREEQIVR